MRNIINKIFVSILCVLLCSCDTNKDIKKEITRFRSQHIILPLEKMQCVENGRVNPLDVNRNDSTVLKQIIFIDSTRCSSCLWKNMSQWNKLLNEVKPYNDKLKFYFIFHTKKENMSLLYKAMESDTEFKHPVFIDTLGCFFRSNPTLPKNPTLHTFLLNEENEVILIGDILYNKRMRELFYKIIEERQQNKIAK